MSLHLSEQNGLHKFFFKLVFLLQTGHFICIIKFYNLRTGIIFKDFDISFFNRKPYYKAMKDLFKINEGILNSLLESADIGIFTTDSGLNIQTWNRWLDIHSQLKESEVAGRNLFEVYPDLISRKLDIYYHQALQGQSGTLPERVHNYLIQIPSGYEDNDYKYMQQNVQIAPLISGDKITGTITIIVDVTKRVRCNKSIEEETGLDIRAKEEFEIAFNSVPDFITIIDTQHRITRINKSMADHLGVKPEDIIGKYCYNVIHKTESPPAFCPHVRLLRDKQECYSNIFEDRLGGYFTITVTPLVDSSGNIRGSVHVAHDISERIKTEKMLQNLSIVDDLTGIYNRRGFMTLTAQLINTADRLSCKMLLLFMDLNDMKYINDTFGHLEGDNALRDTANILRSTFRESDIICRYGGDEFIVSALQTGDIESDTIKERLNKNIDLHNIEANRRYKISLSIGIAIYDPNAPVPLETLIFVADHMMYENKYKLRRKESSES